MSPLVISVRDVVGVRSNKQMRWIAALRDITGMADNHTVRNFSHPHHVGRPVSPYGLANIVTWLDLPVPLFSAALEDPAPVLVFYQTLP